MRSHGLDRFVLTLLLLLLATFAATGSDASVTRFSGGCAPETSPYLATHDAITDGRISYCAGGDAHLDTIEISADAGWRSEHRLLTAGYIDGDLISLIVIGPDGDRLPVVVSARGDQWTPVSLRLPAEWKDRRVTIRLEDRSGGGFGWGGIASAPSFGIADYVGPVATFVAVVAFLHFLLATLLHACRARWPIGTAVPAALVGLGALALLAFLACYLAGTLPLQVGFWGSIAIVAAYHGRALTASKGPASGAGLAQAHLLAAPAAAFSVFLAVIGALFAQPDSMVWTQPAQRWLDLPVDNWLPKILGDMILSGELASPMVGDWLSSDRPPLQAGAYLLLTPAFGDSAMAYQSVGMWLQGIVLVALLALGTGRVGRPSTALVLVAAAFSPLLVIHGYFVWPKLVAAAFCIGYHALMTRPDPQRRGVSALLAGASAAFALLSHGGAFFFLVGSSLWVLALRRQQGIKPLVIAAIAAIALMAPWSAYQKYVDPPGDRLLKWHFAGVIDSSPESLGEALRTAYGPIGASEWMAARTANAEVVAEGALRFPVDMAKLLVSGDAAANAAMIDRSFRNTLYSLWWLSPLAALPFLLWQLARSPARARAVFFDPERFGLIVTAGLGLLVWIAMMFVPGSTTIHQGALATPLVIGLVSLSIVHASSSAAAWILTGMNVLCLMLVFGPPKAVPIYGTTLSELAPLVLAAAVLALTLVAAGRLVDRSVGEPP